MKHYFVSNREFYKSDLEIWAWEKLREVPGWEKSHLLFILQWLAGVDELTLNTSGSTTGMPTKIVIPKKDMEASAKLSAEFFGLPEGTRALLCLHSGFIAGKMMIVRALVNRWKLTWTEPVSSPLKNVTGPFDFAAMTPMQAENSLNDCPEKFNAIPKIIIGGSAISPGLEERLRQCTNQSFATYGMTETVSHVAIRNLNGKNASMRFKALPGVSFNLNIENCLEIRAEHLGNRIIQTHDIVNLINPHEFEFIGRADNVINSGGVKLFPEMIETKISPLLHSRFIIHRIRDGYFGERPVLYIEGAPLSEEELKRLHEVMKTVLQPYEVPKKVEFVDHFDETETGKIIRKNY